MSGAWFLRGHFQLLGQHASARGFSPPFRGGVLLGPAAVHRGCGTRWRQPEGAGRPWPHTAGSSLAGVGVADTPGSCPQERGLLLSALWDTRLTGLGNWKVCQGRKESARSPAPRMPAILWPSCTPSLSRGFGAGRGVRIALQIQFCYTFSVCGL